MNHKGRRTGFLREEVEVKCLIFIQILASTAIVRCCDGALLAASAISPAGAHKTRRNVISFGVLNFLGLDSDTRCRRQWMLEERRGMQGLREIQHNLDMVLEFVGCHCRSIRWLSTRSIKFDAWESDGSECCIIGEAKSQAHEAVRL
ncbi:hypothetical protein Drorol1_Dr00014491 [Drosera rotundifolia]